MPLQLKTLSLDNLRPNLSKSFIYLDMDMNICEKCPHFGVPCSATSTVLIQNREHDDSTDILFVGQGAGKSEDINLSRGNLDREPFVGRAGKYLRDIMMHIWTYEVSLNTGPNIAFSNNVRCHPMDSNGKDRAPTREEIDRCIPYLIDDIVSLQPRFIITLGKSATCSFFPELKNLSMGQLRSKVRAKVLTTRRGKTINPDFIATYHPSYLCRNYGSFKPDADNNFDIKFIQDVMMAIDAMNIS